MENLFDSARYMLARGRLHTSDLITRIGTFINSEPYVVFEEFDSIAQEHVQKVKLIKELPPELDGIAFDAIGNLRAALDHLGFAASANAQGARKKANFPFGENAAAVQGARRGNSQDIAPKLFAVMASYEPHPGGDLLLWSLNELCNAKKHRLLTPMVTIIGGRQDQFVGRAGPSGIRWPDFNGCDKEFEILRWAPGNDFDNKAELSYFITFDQIDAFVGRPVGAILETLASKIESVILDVESESNRA